ncbi:MAG: MFS transporter [Thermoflexales bacterium]|nr:MFS transporter [Thermoflexales bacterium]
MQQTVQRASSGDAACAGAGLGTSEMLAQRHLQQLQSVVRLASLATAALVVALPIYSQNFGASGKETGLLFAIPAFMAAMARPIVGHSMDWLGRKPFLVLSVALMFVAMVVFALAREFVLGVGDLVLEADARFAIAMLFIARTIQGFALGLLLLSAYTITADLARQAGRGASFGYTEEAQYRGGILGGLIALPILLLFGFNLQGELRITQQVWSLVFSLFAVGVLIGVVRALRCVPETRPTSPPQPVHPTREWRALRELDPQLFRLMAIVVFTMASSYGLSPFILVYIHDRVTPNLVFIMLAYLPAALAWAFLPSRLGRIADRVGRRLPIVVGLSTSGVFSMTLPFLPLVFPHPWMVVAALTVFATLEAVCYAAAVPAEQALVADLLGTHQRGIGFGLYTLAQSVGQVVGPVVMGALYDMNHSGPFIANAAILILGSVLVWTLLTEPRRAAMIPPST